MKKYKVTVWYFYGENEEDFEDYDIFANSSIEAIEKARQKHRWIKSIFITKQSDKPYYEKM